MSEVPTILANAVLSKHGFQLRKGDAGRAAAAASGPSDGEIIAAALKVGIMRQAVCHGRSSPSGTDAVSREPTARHAAGSADAVAFDVKAAFGGRTVAADDAHEVATAIVRHVRGAGDLELARKLFTHGTVMSLLTKGGRSRLREMAGEWFKIIDGGKADFGHPIAKLFMALDDAWAKDGRSWYVTVSQGPVPSTFSIDNWMFLLAYGLTGGISFLGKRFGIIVRRFEKLTNPRERMPLKSIGGLCVDGDAVVLLSAGEVQASHGSAPRDGSVELDPDDTVRHVDMAVLCPAFVVAMHGRAMSLGFPSRNDVRTKRDGGFNPTVIQGGRTLH